MGEQLTIMDDLEELAYAIAWTKLNPEAWEQVVTWAHQDRAAGYPPSTRMYLCLLRRPHFASMLGLARMGIEPVLVTDHLSADLARLLNLRYPKLKCPTRHRATRLKVLA